MDDIPIIHKNFEVACGQKANDYFKIDNNSKINKTYEVVRYSKPSEIEVFDYRLKIHPYKIVALPEKTIRFTVTYLSYTENVIENFVYHILDSEKLVAILNVHAKSVGPLLSTTIYNLKFLCFRDSSQTVKNIQIQNNSECEAKYYFDIDEDYKLVQISQASGIIPSQVKLNLKLTFSPALPGVYYKQIFCIVQFHNPIVFNILGVYEPKLKVNSCRLAFKYPPKAPVSHNYESYMTKSNQNTIEEEDKILVLPKCSQECDKSLTGSTVDEEGEEKKYWEVSFCEPPQPEAPLVVNETVANEIVLTNYFFDVRNVPEVHQATTLVNLSKHQSYSYQWNHDPKNQFQIEPCKGILDPGRRADFSIYFTPSAPDFLYHIEVDLRILPFQEENEVQEYVNLPMTMSLRIIGNSFPNNSYGWISQCSIKPKVLHLPYCVPGEVVYGTFMIERRGHLPVTFIIMYPKDSNYIVQPPLGYLSGSFQLLVIQFNNKTQSEGVYKEDLKVVFNDSNSNCDHIRVVTSVEIPRLIFEKDNSYEFEPLFPGSKSVANILVENPTNLYLSYEFNIPENLNWIEIPNPTGTIEPKSFGEVEVVFQPDTPSEYSGCIPCSVSSVNTNECSKTVELQITGSCQFGYLVAIPSIYNFGDCIYFEETHVKIHLYNFSPVLLYFRLYAKSKCIQFRVSKRGVKITPNRGSICGKGSLEVDISVMPHDVDVLQYEVYCQILENYSKDAEPCEKSKVIFTLTFKGVLPTFQIVDINVNGGGPLFSPHWIWKMMSINRINKALKSLTPEEPIDIKCPEAMYKMPPIAIAFLIEANRHGNVYCSIEKSVQCSCFEECQGAVFGKYNCIHSKALLISPKDFGLKPNQRIILQMVLSYEVLEIFRIRLVFNMPYGRKVTLHATLLGLPNDDECSTSMYLLPTMQLKPVFIGDVKPPLQLFWLYNNTYRQTSYVVDKLTLREATPFVHRIFDCVNPNGVIPPFSCVPLAFLFKPNEIKAYTVEVSICLQECNPVGFCLKGDGVPYIQSFVEFSFESTIPEKALLYNANVGLECSVNLLNFKFVRTFSENRRIFLLHNRCQTEAWAFQWHKFFIENLIKVWIEPASGVIEPGKETVMILNLQSFCHPTSISFSLPCDVINSSKLKVYERALRYRDALAEKQKDYFTITEKGIMDEKPEVPIPPKPEPYHLFISVNANIIRGEDLDQKLTINKQLRLKSNRESDLIPNEKVSINMSLIPITQELLEKMLWNILNSNLFKEKIKNLEGCDDYNYLQILHESKQSSEEVNPVQGPNKNFVQNFLEDVLRGIITKNLVSSNCNAK